MIIGIDESGDFSPGSKRINLFVGVHLRQSGELLEQKKSQFIEWENSLPKKLKNHNGEIKSNLISDSDLTDFIFAIVKKEPEIRISPVCIFPSDNEPELIKKDIELKLVGIKNGEEYFKSKGNKTLSNFYNEFYFWLKKLSYNQYIKMLLLGKCISSSLRNAFGLIIANDLNNELENIKFIIDEFYIKGIAKIRFWQEFLRNQMYFQSKSDPVPIKKEWITDGHPFIRKYIRDKKINFSELFLNNCFFQKSHESFEIRIADIICTIIARNKNEDRLREEYIVLANNFNYKKIIECIKFQDFNLEDKLKENIDNPFADPNLGRIKVD